MFPGESLEREPTQVTEPAHDADGARRWEPKRLRHRLYSIPAVLARGGRRVRLRYASHHPWNASHHPWTTLFIAALATLTSLDST